MTLGARGPPKVYCSDTSSGSYILDAVQQFFQLGDEVRKSHASEIQRPHGFGVDHFSSKRQLFLREKALTVRGWRQREPEEYGWVRLNPAQKGREEDASAWCFVSHEGRWKRFSEYKQHREEEQHSKLW
ncbi:hypothetical protein CLAFUW4_10458 [Fulvia fulva]|uniref:Uncharacterized protein n=1 Tax=Passalora fulva TaxID=5499 RepID=A0A9Q8LFU6_PASFU|nr:uncharacterized protein CLAFUR5_05074 [Fulvia fulva]KAK4615712.1 hypothetical protein CLAFUR4_10462 [Fulvia fulva]KAK4616783.1 hypothetical protein CLAFUR0_10463 [Fulvia fulva]UJO16617.1 hypothetical protein CLAFUR5_05074 [Fulvia fulva]WPV19598.1 hypothetical protein CLAFUW4_10458 [Fulvia fulva]WPV34607.1 hypothetical protein CLAFUW7_10458 [Fulvia fulva]